MLYGCVSATILRTLHLDNIPQCGYYYSIKLKKSVPLQDFFIEF